MEATLEVAKSVHERIAGVASIMLDTCAYAGTGNVLKVQEMLSICGETIDAEEGAEWKVRVIISSVIHLCSYLFIVASQLSGNSECVLSQR